MQIIIPMSGFGERFRNAGYTVPKPLIEVDKKPIIEHVINLFPEETNFLFICNNDHLNNPSFQMKEILSKICPTGTIIGIDSHKLGPVHAVLQAAQFIHLNEPVIVNYCDFTCYWNYSHFKQFTESNHFDGIIPAYKGFHPHYVGSTQYAYLKTKNTLTATDIQEKSPFTDNRLEEYASSGTYYFSSGSLLLKACKYVRDHDINVNYEYYISLAYKYLFKHNLSVSVYPIEHFMQWGTPQDLHEYIKWSEIFYSLIKPKKALTLDHHHIIVPMAGLGKRFSDMNYEIPKPMIKVSGKPMVFQSIHSLPAVKSYSFVLRKDMEASNNISKFLKASFKNSTLTIIDHVTNGQACTAAIGLDAIKEQISQEDYITFGVCDSGVVYDQTVLQNFLNNREFDVLVWSTIGHPNAIRNPQMYGWLQTDETQNVKQVSVKIPFTNPSSDPIITGIFTFKNADIFYKCYHSLLERDGRVNNEYYLDSVLLDALNLGLKVKHFIVEHYISWGTPTDFETFQYWQSCLHKWKWHSYSINKDFMVIEKSSNEYNYSIQNSV